MTVNHNLERELNNYIWNDRKAGIPMADLNHGVDPARNIFNIYIMIGDTLISNGIYDLLAFSLILSILGV